MSPSNIETLIIPDCNPLSRKPQTKDLATRYERALQDSETTTEKCKNRLEVTSEELERVLLQKEGESLKDTAVQSRSGVAGKRVIGKAVAKGNLLMRGKNPGNVRSLSLSLFVSIFFLLSNVVVGEFH